MGNADPQMVSVAGTICASARHCPRQVISTGKYISYDILYYPRHLREIPRQTGHFKLYL